MFSLTHSFLSHSLLVCHHPACVHTQWRASSCSSLVITPPTPASRLLPALPPLFSSFGPFHPLIFTGTSLPLVATGGGLKRVRFHKVPVRPSIMSALSVCGFSFRPAREL